MSETSRNELLPSAILVLVGVGFIVTPSRFQFLDGLEVFGLSLIGTGCTMLYRRKASRAAWAILAAVMAFAIVVGVAPVYLT